ADDGYSGLSDAYVRRFGWEEDALTPFADRPTHDAPPIAAYHAWSDAPTSLPAPADASPISVDEPKNLQRKFIDTGEALEALAALGLAAGALVGGHRLGTPRRAADRVRLRFADDQGVVEIDLWPRDPARAAFARTASLDLTHPLLAEDATIRARPLLAAHLTARDQGDLWSALTTAAGSDSRSGSGSDSGSDSDSVSGAFARWPGAELPAARALLEAIEALVARGWLHGREVEPSVALG